MRQEQPITKTSSSTNTLRNNFPLPLLSLKDAYKVISIHINKNKLGHHTSKYNPCKHFKPASKATKNSIIVLSIKTWPPTAIDQRFATTDERKFSSSQRIRSFWQGKTIMHLEILLFWIGLSVPGICMWLLINDNARVMAFSTYREIFRQIIYPKAPVFTELQPWSTPFKGW